uniref:CSON011109 protein n=1 Tax=Culicoides sonorensis TaxID=179676 RepID=A0A336LYU5_CULSO
MSTTQLICLGVNALVLVYYGRKYIKIRSFYNKTEKATSVIKIDSETLSSLIGQYVIISGKIKALAETLPSQYTSALQAKFESQLLPYFDRKHCITRIAGFWIRKGISTTVTSEKATLFALIDNVPVDGNETHVIIQNPLHALRQTAAADLFTGYKNVSWPASNIVHDRFIVNTESTNPLKIMLCGSHEMGIQETESLILDGGYITAVGYLMPSHDGNFRIAAEMLTTCDKSMLLKKVGDLRAELVSKLIFYGTITAILCLFILKRKWKQSRKASETI